VIAGVRKKGGLSTIAVAGAASIEEMQQLCRDQILRAETVLVLVPPVAPPAPEEQSAQAA
jgi:hypothetical protein